MPLYLTVAVAAYLFLALAGLIDKVLLKTAIVSPRAYAFYVGLLGVGVLILLPFGVVARPDLRVLISALASGVYGTYALWAFYSALKAHAASRVITTVGALTPVLTLLLSVLILGESLNGYQVAGFGILVLGGFLVSYRENVKKPYSLELLGHAARAAVLFAASFVLLRFVFTFEPFLNGFFWARIGGLLGALSIVIIPENFRRIYWATRKAPPTAPLPFFFNQGLGGAGAILQNYAIFLGSASLVAAVQGVQYVFILVLAVLLGRYLPNLKESFTPFKILAVLVVGAGLYLISLN